MVNVLRRVVLLLLAAVIVAAPLVAVAELEFPVLAEEPVPAMVGTPSGAPERSMETALVAAKSLIDIDDDVFTEFSYSSHFSNRETMEGLIWSFYWSSTDHSQIYASVTEEGVLLNFNKYSWEDSGFGFADVSRSAAIAIADEFIRKANPDTYSYYKAPAVVHTNIRSSDYRLTYFAEANGYYFEAANIFVSINKYTGEVTGYNTNRIDPGRFTFEAATDIIEESAAVAAYAEKIGLTLEYKSYFDFENSSIKVFPVYLFNSHGDRFIGARTGEIATYVYDLGVNDEDMMFSSLASAPMVEAEAAADGAAGGFSARSLTPAEREAIEQVAGFITSEQALQRLLEATELTSLNIASFDQQQISLNRDYMDRNRYIYDIYIYKHTDFGAAEDEITSVFGRVEATTGRVISFNIQYHGFPVSSNQSTMTEAQAEAAVTAFLRRMASSEFAKTELETIQPPSAVPFSFRGGSYFFNYIRYENNIPFRDNRINVTINEHTRKITSYSLNWYNNATFPSITNVLTPERALAGFVSQTGTKINYITTGEGKATLVYDFNSRDFIDPFTGNALDHTGALRTDSVVTPDYSDVSGHWSEGYVTKLLDNGIFMWGGKFEPDKVMTELEFLEYLMLIEPYSHFPRTEAQAYFAQRGVNVEASPDKLLTRQEAVRIITEFLGYGKLAEQSEWFVYPFTDHVAAEYRGYITICYMLGIINGSNGRFNASSNVTRAHAAAMLHNLIIVQSA